MSPGEAQRGRRFFRRLTGKRASYYIAVGVRVCDGTENNLEIGKRVMGGQDFARMQQASICACVAVGGLHTLVGL